MDQQRKGQPSEPPALGDAGFRSIHPPPESVLRRLGQVVLYVVLILFVFVWLLVFVGLFGDLGGVLGVGVFTLLVVSYAKWRAIRREAMPLTAVDQEAEALAQARQVQQVDMLSETARPSTALRWAENLTRCALAITLFLALFRGLGKALHQPNGMGWEKFIALGLALFFTTLLVMTFGMVQRYVLAHRLYARWLSCGVLLVAMLAWWR